MDKKAKIVLIASLAAIAITCGLLAIPQFIVPNNYPTLGSINGYRFFFYWVDNVYFEKTKMVGPSGLGIASIVLMVLAVASYLASTKSSAFLMLGGILNVATSVLFFAMEASKKHVYGSRYSFVNVGWPAYVIGALLVITGLASMYIAFRCLQSERKDLGSKKSYSYLKK